MAATEHEIERMVVRLVGDASEYTDTLEDSIKATEDFVQQTESISDDSGIYQLQEDFYKLSEEMDQTTKRVQMFALAQQELDEAFESGHISQEEFNQGQDALNAVIGESNAILAAIRDSTNDYANAVSVLDRHLQQGLLSQEEHREASIALAQGSEEAKNALREMKDEARELERAERAAARAAKEFARDALRDLNKELRQADAEIDKQNREWARQQQVAGNSRKETMLLAKAMGQSSLAARALALASSPLALGLGDVAIAGAGTLAVVYKVTEAVAGFTAESIKLAATSTQHKALIENFEALNDEVTSLKMDVGNAILDNFDFGELANDAAAFVNEMRDVAPIFGALAADAQMILDDLKEMGIDAGLFVDAIALAADYIHSYAVSWKETQLAIQNAELAVASFFDFFGITSDGVIDEINESIRQTTEELNELNNNKPSSKLGGGGNDANEAAAERQRVASEKYTDTLAKEYQQLGLTKDELRRLALAQMDLTDAQKKEAEVVINLIEKREKFLKQQEEMKKKTEELADMYVDTFMDAMNNASKASAQLTEDGKAMAASLNDEIHALNLEAMGVESVSDEIALYKLMKAGASEETIKNIRHLMDEKEALEEQAKMQKEAKKVIEDLQTPMEEYRKERERINKLNQQNLLTDEQATKALNNLQEEFMKGADAADYMDASVQSLYASLQDNAAVTRGSAELRELQRSMLEDSTIRGAADKLNHEGETSPLLAFDAPLPGGPPPQQGLLVDAKLTVLANFLKAIETNTKEAAEKEPAEFEVVSF